MKKLPIGIQSFDKIRDKSESYVYVDKTKYIYDLIKSGSSYNFIARPRRFGKSLMIDTIKCLFEGKKQLFEGLYVYDKRNWNEINPVIRLSFSGGNFQSIKGIEEIVMVHFNQVIKKYNLEVDKTMGVQGIFMSMIQELYAITNKKVVVLIDEYDKPILDNITDKDQAKKTREFLKGVYGVLKDSDAYLRYVFLTGVSKFSKVSLFSGLNNLEDLSFNKETGVLCGYTEQEITDNFQDYLEGVDREEMKRWYNGFNFLGKEKVYNPFDVLLFLKNKEYKNYWFETATPTFLMHILKSNPEFYYIPNLLNLRVGEELIGSFDIENIDIETLLYQTGYLTIKDQYQDIMGIQYTLEVPNFEIRQSLNKYIMYDYLKSQSITKFVPFGQSVLKEMRVGNAKGFIELFKSMFAGISYSSVGKIAKYEGYYSSVIYVLMFSMGLNVVQEDITNQGRIDLTIKIDEYIYVMEFKVEKSERTAIEQIKQNKYYEKYLGEKGKKVYLVGIDFSFEDRNISGYEIEEIK